jgi:hypothetical protein
VLRGEVIVFFYMLVQERYDRGKKYFTGASVVYCCGGVEVHQKDGSAVKFYNCAV